ncbi:MAG: WD40 repeat domain-containing protein, partial [Planctomycetota bacterium]
MTHARARRRPVPAACAIALAALAATLMPGCGEAPVEEAARPLPKPEKKQQRPRVDLHGDPLPEGAIARCGTVRFRHGSSVDAVAFSPDGVTLVSSGYASTLRFWDSRTGREVRTLDDGAASV